MLNVFLAAALCISALVLPTTWLQAGSAIAAGLVLIAANLLRGRIRHAFGI